MDNNILKKLSSIVSKMPKKDLEKNLNKAKDLIKNSNKEEIKELLETEQVKKMLGNDTEKLKEILDKTDISRINTEALEQDLTNVTKESN